MLNFTNKQLSKISLQVRDIETEFHDGVYLILLMGLLEGYFVPLHAYHLTPKDTEQKLGNVRFCFDLMRDVGIDTSKIRPEGKISIPVRLLLENHGLTDPFFPRNCEHGAKGNFEASLYSSNSIQRSLIFYAKKFLKS